jgi:hypothetical protein
MFFFGNFLLLGIEDRIEEEPHAELTEARRELGMRNEQ